MGSRRAGASGRKLRRLVGRRVEQRLDPGREQVLGARSQAPRALPVHPLRRRACCDPWRGSHGDRPAGQQLVAPAQLDALVSGAGRAISACEAPGRPAPPHGRQRLPCPGPAWPRPPTRSPPAAAAVRPPRALAVTTRCGYGPAPRRPPPGRWRSPSASSDSASTQSTANNRCSTASAPPASNAPYGGKRCRRESAQLHQLAALLAGGQRATGCPDVTARPSSGAPPGCPACDISSRNAAISSSLGGGILAALVS